MFTGASLFLTACYDIRLTRLCLGYHSETTIGSHVGLSGLLFSRACAIFEIECSTANLPCSSRARYFLVHDQSPLTARMVKASLLLGGALVCRDCIHCVALLCIYLYLYRNTFYSEHICVRVDIARVVGF